MESQNLHSSIPLSQNSDIASNLKLDVDQNQQQISNLNKTHEFELSIIFNFICMIALGIMTRKVSTVLAFFFDFSDYFLYFYRTVFLILLKHRALNVDTANLRHRHAEGSPSR